MSGVTAVAPGSQVTGHRATAPVRGAADPSLLPAPGPGALAGSDAMSMLYYFESKDGQDGVKTGEKRIQGLDVERKQALDKELQAIQKQDDAASHHDFWSDLGNVCGEVAKVASVVASIAAAVGTCGAATPLAALAIGGAILSTAAFTDGELHVLQKLGVDEKTAGLVDMGMSLAGAATSVGAGLAAGGTAASNATEMVGRTAAVAAGVATVGKGASEIEAGEALADEDRALAAQVAAQSQTGTLQRSVQHVIDEVKDSDHKSKQYLKTIADTQAVQMQTMTIATSAVKG